MKKVRFRDPSGMERYGQCSDGEVRFGNNTYSIDDVELLPPTKPTKLVNFGHNQYSYVKTNYGGPHPDLDQVETPETPEDIPRQIRAPNSVSGPGDTVTLISNNGEYEYIYELEMGVVIGEQCKEVPSEDAHKIIDGYTITNDITCRGADYWIEKKAFDNSFVFGPAVAAPEVVPENANAEVRINNKTVIDSELDFIHPVSDLIEEITRRRTFEKGDIITTGCVKDVGALSDGDDVELTIEGIGTLKHSVEIT